MTMRKGRFETANKGTIFLDEIGEMTAATRRSCCASSRSGSSSGSSNVPIKIDIRVITATNRDLAAEVDEAASARTSTTGSTSSTSTCRRSASKEDIPLLVEHFLVKYRYEAGAIPTTITEDALKRLVDYDWPGNVRELENAIERAVVLSRGNPITLEHLPFDRACPS